MTGNYTNRKKDNKKRITDVVPPPCVGGREFGHKFPRRLGTRDPASLSFAKPQDMLRPSIPHTSKAVCSFRLLVSAGGIEPPTLGL